MVERSSMVSRLQNRLPVPLGAAVSLLVFVAGAVSSDAAKPLEASVSAPVQASTRPAAAPVLVVPVPSADLGEIRKRPVFFRGETVQFILQVGPENPTWNPYLTRFDTKRFRSWNAWSDSQAIWHYPDYQDSASRFFARRGSKAALFLSDAAPFDRFLVTATVRTIFMGEPWIEMHIATPLELSIGKGTLLHASRAMDFAGEKLFRAAADQFKRALAAPMPPAMEQRMRAELKAAESNIEGPAEENDAEAEAATDDPVKSSDSAG
ncbi:MAG: hypothetical protein ACI8Q9_001682 [Planctomycetota bacterium]|jgi:hypothetical protein